MKCSLLRRILVGALTLTTICSSLGTTVVYAVDGDVPSAIVYEADTEESGDSIFEPVSEASDEQSATEEVQETEDESESGEADPATEESGDATDETDLSGQDEQETEGQETEGEKSDSESESEAEVTEESQDSQESEDQDTEDAEESEEASDEASSEDSDEEDPEAEELIEDEDEAEGKAKDKLKDKDKDKDKEKDPKALDTATSASIETDLSNPAFGVIEKVIVPDSIANIGDKINIGFTFFIKDAMTIPDGKFTYTLPDNLDFSVAAGKEIPVYEDGVQIGTAQIGDDGVIYFQIDPEIVTKKPNGLHGSVGLTCIVNDDSDGDEETVKISFTNGQDVEIKITNPVIDAGKGDVVISNGGAWWEVSFDVKADRDGFVITDTLGSNLEFTGQYSFIGPEGTLPAEFTVTDDGHKLKVNVGHISAGQYTLRYQVKALDSISTDSMSDEEKFSKNGNTCNWTWDGTNSEHEVTGQATQTEAEWLSKYGEKGTSTGTVSPTGIATWQVYINSGSMPHNLAGYTFVDELDGRMEFADFNIRLMISEDGNVWKDYKTLDESYFEYNDATGQWTLKFHFDESTPVAYYKLVYNTKVKELPTSKTTYTNKAAIYKDGDLIAEVSADSVYSFSGVFTSSITKGMTGARNDGTGIVEWQADFSVAGDKGTYPIYITDTIAPIAGNKVINGKPVAAKIIPGSIKIYKSDGNGNIVEGPLAGVGFKYLQADTVRVVAYLAPGTYLMKYQTMDYYGTEDVHAYPGGSAVTFNNHIELKIDKTTITADAAYDVESAGLPMKKSSARSHYDPDTDEYIIPWTITVNENEFFQSSSSITAGAQAVITDILPENLSYKAGSAQIQKLDGTVIGSLPARTFQQNGRQAVEWKFEWPADLGSVNACVIKFETVVDKAYLNKLMEESTDSSVSFSFKNTADGNVGGHEGSANATSSDSFTILDKSAALDEESQRINYSIVVNEKGVDLVPGDEIRLTDDITNGVLVAGSLHVYDYTGGQKGAEITLDAGKIVTKNKNRSFEIVVPDERALLIEYQVMPDISKGVSVGNGQTSVEISNKATLYAEFTKSDVVDEKYTFDEVQASITSERGEIKITKVETGNVLTGLAGAVFALYRVDLSTGLVTEVARKDTTAPDYSITFSEDGQFDSLIFDTLYYYQEIKAPTGYQLDDTKHYVVFKGRNYDSVKEAVESYLKSVNYKDFKAVDVLNGESSVDTVVENSRTKEPPYDPPKDPEKKIDPPTDNTVITVTTSTANAGGSTVTVLDLPFVLGASRDPEDLPEVLGARRADTSDRDMTGAFAAIIMALAALVVLLTRRDKDDKLN